MWELSSNFKKKEKQKACVRLPDGVSTWQVENLSHFYNLILNAKHHISPRCQHLLLSLNPPKLFDLSFLNNKKYPPEQKQEK